MDHMEKEPMTSGEKSRSVGRNPGEGKPCELALVMPVYNEEACIFGVIQSWEEELTRQGIDFQMIVLNDGSQDGTEAILEKFRNHPPMDIIHKKNRGHGPTILEGYRKAVCLAQWVFQTDSDDEMKSGHFIELWSRRKDFDALIGIRQERRQPILRRLTTMGSRLAVYLFFGKAVTDVNIPYRLIRASCLKPIIQQIPNNTFSPNILISGALSRSSLRIHNHLIPCEGRKTGSPSLMRWKLIKVILISFLQFLRFRLALKRRESLC
jgi:glycosyltransferase involved in cell wall biosynthesis